MFKKYLYNEHTFCYYKKRTNVSIDSRGCGGCSYEKEI